jgi:hypothetical protein
MWALLSLTTHRAPTGVVALDLNRYHNFPEPEVAPRNNLQ